MFAPRVALPAVVRAIALGPDGAIEAKASIAIEGADLVVLWDATAVERSPGRLAVEYRASAPLTFTHVSAWITDATGRPLGKTISASRVEVWQPGSAGARDLGLGTVSGGIDIRGRIAAGSCSISRGVTRSRAHQAHSNARSMASGDVPGR